MMLPNAIRIRPVRDKAHRSLLMYSAGTLQLLFATFGDITHLKI